MLTNPFIILDDLSSKKVSKEKIFSASNTKKQSPFLLQTVTAKGVCFFIFESIHSSAYFAVILTVALGVPSAFVPIFTMETV